MNLWRVSLTGALVMVAFAGAWLAHGVLLAQEKSAPTAPPIRWEYKMVGDWELERLGEPDKKPEPGVLNENAVAKGLNRVGAEGWELVAVNDRNFYLKRPRPAN